MKIRIVNITLIILCVITGATAAILLWLPSPVLSGAYGKAGFQPAPSKAGFQPAPESASVSDTSRRLETCSTAPSSDTHRRLETCSTAATNSDAIIAKGIRTKIPQVSLSSMSGPHPFAAEARKVLSGNLAEDDSIRRRQILNYCEHFRVAYPTRDIDFLRQVFSDDALIIVGSTVSASKDGSKAGGDAKVRYARRSKSEYLSRLKEVFAANKKIDVKFSDFHIMRHPTSPDIYGVTLRQMYESDRYSDDGYIFLLWDFGNPSMPVIHVRTWQPAPSLSDEDDVIGIGDFNLE